MNKGLILVNEFTDVHPTMPWSIYALMGYFFQLAYISLGYGALN